jgi:predicted RNA binding protein YcfA (HicA-like mRNA interferase family)
MTRLPRVKPRSLVKALKRVGFVERRQKGSHLIMVRESDGRQTIVPMHLGRDIPIGTLHGILRDADLSAEEFERLLKG